MTRFFFRPLVLLIASKTMPEANAPSPITATAWRPSAGRKVVAALQPQRGRYAAAGVAGHEQIVGAFSRVRISHQAAVGANRGEVPCSGR